MKKLKWVGGVVLAAGLAALPVLAQEAAKKEPPKPAPSPSQAVLEQWNDIGRKLIIMAEDFPDEKYERSEEHTSELQSHLNLVCRLLLEKKKKKVINIIAVSTCN